MLNALGIDLEDWYHVCGIDSLAASLDKDIFISRAISETERILEIFRREKVRATFFVLGSLAEKFPNLIRKINSQGHEIASHSYLHKELHKQNPEDFLKDLQKSMEILKSITGKEVLGFRAPDFSIIKNSFWAVDVLLQAGIRYDCSIFPVKHPRYGIPDAPRFIYKIREELIEFPPSTLRILGYNLPFAGGAYFRIFPYAFTKWAIRQINKEGFPVNIYLHPWELDPVQPKLELPWSRGLTHYINLKTAEGKFRRLLRDFKFAPIKEVLGIG
jgi:polysaccharide deacetylase family protein (PEP-CTERM system associated)